MKQLTFDDKTFEAEKIVKYPDAIIGTSGGSEVFAFKGIADFTAFQLKSGQTFDDAPTSEDQRFEKLEADNAKMRLQLEALSSHNEFLEETLTELIITVMP